MLEANEEIGVLLRYPSVEYFDQALNAMEDAAPMKLRVKGASYLVITMSCREKLTIRTRGEFPKEDVPCTCGKKSHWFIKHEIPGNDAP